MSRTGGGKEVLTIAAVGVGVAALGLGLAALPGAATLGVLGGAALSSSFARRAKPPLRPADVRRDEQGRVQNWAQLLRAVQHGGVAPELRAELWPLLLGVFPPASTQVERTAELERLRRLYIKLVLVCRELDEQLQALRSSGGGGGAAGRSSAAAAAAAAAPPASSGASEADTAGGSAAGAAAADASVRSEAGSLAPGAPSPPPLPGNLAAFAEAHRIIVMDAVRTDLRRSTAAKSAIGGAAGGGNGGGGAAPGSPTLTILPVAVGDGLPELMLVTPSEPPPAVASTDAELAGMAADLAAAAAAGRLPRWRSPLAGDMLWGATHLDDPTRTQMLRLINLLSAYAVHDPETGYCQGMSDLASIFVQLFEDDALAFACFERLMRSARRNFKHDETGIRHQLQQIARVLRDTDPSLYRRLQQLGAEDCMFAYRMVVVMLRRELPPAACCTLWEMQWAHEAAEAEAAAAAGGGPMARTISGESGVASSASADAPSSSSTAAAGLRSTVQGLSEATAAARATAAAGARPGSGKHGGSSGSASSSTAAAAAAAAAAGGASSSSGPSAEDPPEFVLQFIAAVVRAQRGRILSDCREHDDVLRLFAALDIDFWLAVAQARKQHRAYVGPPGGALRP